MLLRRKWRKNISTKHVELKRWELEEERHRAEGKVAGDSQAKREEKAEQARRLFCTQVSTEAGVRRPRFMAQLSFPLAV